ncbi:MAG: radical SAM protein [archaeon]
MKIQTFNIVAGTTACNASCPFCISRMTPSDGVNERLQKINWINFRKACEMAKTNGVNTVLFTGKGEPLLFPNQITEFLKEMEKFNFPIVELQTNALELGRNPKKLNPYLKKWRNLGLNTFVLSIVHYKDDQNKKIYSPNTEYINLEKTIKYLHEKGF